MIVAHSSPDAARQQIVEIIGNCVYHALGLKESLEDELRALEEQDMDSLRSAIDNKSNCVESLRKLEDQRRVLCETAGFESGPEQMEQMTTWCDDDSVLANCWQHLLDIAVECNALNLTNGSIIRSRKQQIETSLAVIRGGAPEAGIYGRSGHGANGPSQRSLAEA